MPQTPPPSGTNPCKDYTAPPDLPTDRPSIETLWTKDAAEWLDRDLFSIFGVTTGDDLIRLVEPPRLLAGRIRKLVPAGAWRDIEDAAQVYADFYPALKKEPDLRTLADKEDYTPYLKALDWEYAFPVAGGTYANDWGAERPQNAGYASTRHLGTDIFAQRGTPVLAVTNGTIFRSGWNYLGGWMVTLRGEDGLFYYFAHMDAPPPWTRGELVHRRDVLGAVGDTGEGPEGTRGGMPPHLHLGVYTDGERDYATNPYSYLRFWETHPPDTREGDPPGEHPILGRGSVKTGGLQPDTRRAWS